MVRFKNRWLLVEFIPVSNGAAGYEPSESLNGKHIWLALRESVLANFGDAGWGAVSSSLTVKYFSPMTNLAIVRVSRDHYRIAWAAATLMKSMQGKTVVPNVVHVSGTIKHTQMAAIVHNRTTIAKLRALSNMPVAYQTKYDEFMATSIKEIEALRD